MNIRMRPDPFGSSCDPWQASWPCCSPIFWSCSGTELVPVIRGWEWARVTPSATSRTGTSTIGTAHSPRAADGRVAVDKRRPV
jgi:hypothetical protein